MGTRKTTLGTKHKPKKAIKGSVSIQKLANTTRFKYRYRGEVYFLTIPKRDNIHVLLLEQIRRGIEADIFLQEHDNSQKKYKQWLKQKVVKTEAFEKTEVITEAPKPISPPVPLPMNYINKSFEKLSLYEQLLQWSKITGRTDDKEIYHYAFSMVSNWIKAGEEVNYQTLPELLTSMKYAATTYNTRKFVLGLFCSWLVKKKVIETNPFEDVAIKKNSKAKDPRRQRLNDDEVNKILHAIKHDSFLPKNNRGYKHSHYYPIFLFLACTGCRPSEAIGLQVKKVNFSNCTIKIDSAFARTMKGSSHACRKMKSTKTTEERDLPFEGNQELKQVLLKHCNGKMPSDFVFQSPNGLCCYDRALNDTVLKRVLKGLNIPERILYVFRHSFASRCFEQGMDIKSVQALTGHRDVNVLLNIYAEVNQAKVSLPNIGI